MSNPRREAMLTKIQGLHEADEHEKILEEINRIPREFWDYDVTCFYSRALNNLERYEEALELLMGIKNQGRNDPLWNFRTGYSLYYLGREKEASGYFQKAIDLGDDCGDTIELLEASIKEAEQKKINKGEDSLILYTEKEMEAIEKHIEKYFGDYKNVFHEVNSSDIHVDIAIVPPTPYRNYYVLVTMGMGARKMDTPPELQDYKLERAELLVCLPSDWKFNNLCDEKWYWPIRWLKILARLPLNENTWLGWGHTIPNGSPFAENTSLSAVMLIVPGAFGKKSYICRLPNGDEVNFYQMLPLYDEEMRFKLDRGAEALLDLMKEGDLEYLKLKRRSVTE